MFFFFCSSPNTNQLIEINLSNRIINSTWSRLGNIIVNIDKDGDEDEDKDEDDAIGCSRDNDDIVDDAVGGGDVSIAEAIVDITDDIDGDDAIEGDTANFDDDGSR